MNTTIKYTFEVAVSVAALALSAFGLSACSQQLAAFVTGQSAYHPNYWVIEDDTSGSTDTQTYPGGPYERQTMEALVQAARDQGTIYAASIDGNAIADGSWQINSRVLRTSAGDGSAQLAQAARVQIAKRLLPEVRALLRSRPTNGSDILGALQRAALLDHDLPPGAPRTLVLLTDGAINLSRYGGYDVYTDPPDSQAMRHRLIAQWRHSGELPRLPDWKVYLGGIGVGIGDRATARGVIALWQEMASAMGAKLMQINSTLTFG